jgi:CheY-like chemotaxis protein
MKMDKRVFLIDDEASLRRSVSMGLLQKGYDTEPCETGLKALKTLETYKQHQTSPDCIILDVRLPDIDGIKLLRVIKQNYPEIPVVMITGYSQDMIAEEAQDEKADAYLEKPFSIDQLSDILDGFPQKSKEAATTRKQPTTVSAYALLKFNDNADLMKIYNELYFEEHVLYCDATKGDSDLVLLMQSDSMASIQKIAEEKLMSKDVFAEVSIMPCEAPIIEENLNSIMQSVDKALGRDRAESTDDNQRSFRSGASSYVFMQIEKERFDTIYPTLYLNDNVVHCDYIKGKFDIALLVKGTSFKDIDETIKSQIKPIDGVLKIKECPIINFFEN